MPTKVCLVKAMVFPVVMYGCESWTIKKLSMEGLMLLNCGVKKTLESPSDCKEIQPVNPKGNQSWIFIGSTNVEAETPIFWPPDVKNWLVGKDPVLGKIEGRRRRGWQRMRCLLDITNSMDMSSSIFSKLIMDREAWHAADHGVSKSQTWLSNWTELMSFQSNECNQLILFYRLKYTWKIL